MMEISRFVLSFQSKRTMQARAAAARRSRGEALSIILVMARAMAGTSPYGTSRAVSSLKAKSPTPPISVQTTGVP